MRPRDVWDICEEGFMLSHCAPVFFLPFEGALPEAITNNATLALIDTGLRQLLVTCCHVWHGFIDYADQNPGARLATLFHSGFGHATIMNGETLINSDRDLDLAVFEATPFQWNMGLKRFLRPDQWPIPVGKPGEAIAFLGFTGSGRRTQSFIGDVRYSSFGLSASASSDRKLILGKEVSTRRLYDNVGRPISPIQIGGLSGSPAYSITRNGTYRLTGFVQMGPDSDGDIFLTHAQFLNRDGTLSRS